MTTEYVLLLGLFAFILGGVFLNPNSGPVATFRSSGPRLAAVVERDVSVGRVAQPGLLYGFVNAATGDPTVVWADPNGN